MNTAPLLWRPSPQRRLRATLPVLFLATFSAFASVLLAADSGGAFVVVVNAGNPQAEMTPEAISALFLKKTEVWPRGIKAFPVDLASLAPARTSFSQAVHQRSPAAVKAYWQKMIFSGRIVPPPELESPEEVLAFVRERIGGIGYVPAGTPLGPGVRALAIRR